MKINHIIPNILIVTACSKDISRISSRSPDLYEKQKDPVNVFAPTENGSAPKLYVKKPEIVISPSLDPQESGSLSNPEDSRIHLFSDSRPLRAGRFIPIKVVSTKNISPSEEESPTKEQKEKSGDSDKSTEKDPLEEELLKSLPELTPAKSGDPSLLKQFKMKIMHVFPNGDVLARFLRNSSNQNAESEIKIDAKIPFEKISSGEDITTADLVDVRFFDQTSGDEFIRESTQWEDEYSLRISGFNEAKSQATAELDAKRQELENARLNLEQRIKSFAAERRKSNPEKSGTNNTAGENNQLNSKNESANKIKTNSEDKNTSTNNNEEKNRNSAQTSSSPTQDQKNSAK